MTNFLISFIYGFSILFIIFLIIIVLSSKRNKTTIYFSIALLCFLGWVSTLYILYQTQLPHILFIGRLNFAFAIGLLPSVSLFIQNYPKDKNNTGEIFIIIETLALLTITMSTPLIVQSEKRIGTLLETEYGNGYYLFLVHFIFYAIILSLKTFQLLKSAHTKNRKQISILFWSVTSSVFLALLANILTPLIFLNTQLITIETYNVIQNLSLLTVYTFGIPITYVILRYQFLDTKILLGKVLEILFSAIFTLLFGIFSFKLLDFLSLLSWLEYLLAILLVFIFTISYDYISKLIKKNIKSYVTNYEYDTDKILRSFEYHLDSAINLEDMMDFFEKDIYSNLNTNSIVLFLNDQQRTNVKKIFGENQIFERDILELQNLSKNIWNTKIISIFSDFIKIEIPKELKAESHQLSKVVGLLDKLGLKAIIPIFNRKQLKGIILLSDKKNKGTYNSQDINFWEETAHSLGWAINRMSLYKEIENLNASLQHKVDLQTQELQQKVKELQEARRKEADMIDIMGHELRTPMSVVKLNTDLLHNFTHNVEKRKEDYKKYVKRIKDAVETEIKLINTLLSSAKLEGDKIELNPEKVDIREQIKMVLHAQEDRANKKGIKLITEFNTHQPYVFADHSRIVEVLSNLIDNAVKYTQEGSVTIKTEDQDRYIKTSIIDTGPGMTDEDLKNLGKKFFRTGNYTQSELNDDIDIVRPGGTGLGLYVTFNLIRKMGGEIHVESEVGKGSSFIFTLPTYNGQESKSTDGSKDMFSRLGLRE
jgi:signal transduction histidine kinase